MTLYYYEHEIAKLYLFRNAKKDWNILII